jgi:hypothetical protein
MDGDRLSDYPWVIVRIGCDLCKRSGSYRLARLASKFGAEASLVSVLLSLSADCPWRDGPDARKKRGKTGCRARFVDLGPFQPPPDLPPSSRRLEVIEGGRIVAAAARPAQRERLSLRQHGRGAP